MKLLPDDQGEYWKIKTVSAYITIGLQILAIILIILTRGK